MSLVLRQQGIILVDFDNCAYIWKHGKDAINRNKGNSMLSELIHSEDYFGKYGRINGSLMNTLREEKKNFGVYMLSHCSNSFEFEEKVETLKIEAPNLFDGYMFSDSIKGKVEIAKELTNYIRECFPCCYYKRVIMIDDSYELKQMFIEEGMEFYYPIELMGYGIPEYF